MMMGFAGAAAALAGGGQTAIEPLATTWGPASAKGTLRAIPVTGAIQTRGGDGFALIIDKVHAEADLDGMAAKLRAVLGKPFLPLGIPVATGASIGWALFPADGHDMAPLLAVADRRMSAEKLASRRGARARA